MSLVSWYSGKSIKQRLILWVVAIGLTLFIAQDNSELWVAFSFFAFPLLLFLEFKKN